MFIQCSKTPNPNTLKFIVTDIKIVKHTTFYDKQDDYSNSPLACVLFAMNDIQSILLGNNFISITKETKRKWEAEQKRKRQADAALRAKEKEEAQKLDDDRALLEFGRAPEAWPLLTEWVEAAGTKRRFRKKSKSEII